MVFFGAEGAYKLLVEVIAWPHYTSLSFLLFLFTVAFGFCPKRHRFCKYTSMGAIRERRK